MSKLLGHTSLTTTTRYLNITFRGLHSAMKKFEEARGQKQEAGKDTSESVAQSLHTLAEDAQAVVRDRKQARSKQPSVN